VAIFEAVHGSAPDIVGRNIANPSALLLGAVMMLQHLELHDEADRVRRALEETVRNRDSLTPDLGGNSTTEEFTSAIIRRL